MSRVLPLLLLLLTGPAMAQQAPDAAERFAQRRLLRSDYQQVVALHAGMEPQTDKGPVRTPLDEYTPATVERWGVFMGTGEQLDAFDFAERVGDTPTLEELRTAVDRSRTRGWLGTGLGLALLGGGVGLVTASNADGGYEQTRTIQGVTGAAMSLGGLAGLSMGLRVAIAPASLHRAVEKRWTPERADELISAYNDALREELGLEPEQP